MKDHRNGTPLASAPVKRHAVQRSHEATTVPLKRVCTQMRMRVTIHVCANVVTSKSHMYTSRETSHNSSPSSGPSLQRRPWHGKAMIRTTVRVPDLSSACPPPKKKTKHPFAKRPNNPTTDFACHPHTGLRVASSGCTSAWRLRTECTEASYDHAAALMRRCLGMCQREKDRAKERDGCASS